MPTGLILERSISGSDQVSIKIEVTETEILLRYLVPGGFGGAQNIFLALRTHRDIGSAVLPFAQNAEGSTVFLPFKADLLLSIEARTDEMISLARKWENWRWTDRERTDAIEANRDELVFHLSRDIVVGECIDFVLYAKDPKANEGWGWFWGCSDRTVDGGIGDKFIPHYHELQLESEQVGSMTLRRRHDASETRTRIYQMFVRLFGNTNETRKQNGTLAQNGAGKFADINEAALGAIRAMGFTHIWLTGVLQQATATDYSEFGQPADDTDLLKGLAGSPYAIKDYFDVCPDYAINPGHRLKEFQQLLERLHQHGLKAIIDLVPNHVARSYGSCVKPECNFGSCGGAGAGDDKTKFFHPHNNFFYLTPDGNGPPLRLPTFRDGQPISATCQAAAAVYDGGHRPPLQQWDGLFARETTVGRGKGNNCVSWAPQLHDLDETVELEYSFDLLNAGFNAVYDAPVYRALKRIYDGTGWANDIDHEITDEFICHNSVRYAENHDEVRLAARHEWGGVGMEVGRPVSAILYGLSRGAIMLYNGQEIGAPGEGTEGFGNEEP